MKKIALIAALSVVGIANVQAADGTITINGLVTDKLVTSLLQQVKTSQLLFLLFLDKL